MKRIYSNLRCVCGNGEWEIFERGHRKSVSMQRVNVAWKLSWKLRLLMMPAHDACRSPSPKLSGTACKATEVGKMEAMCTGAGQLTRVSPRPLHHRGVLPPGVSAAVAQSPSTYTGGGSNTSLYYLFFLLLLVPGKGPPDPHPPSKLAALPLVLCEVSV